VVGTSKDTAKTVLKALDLLALLQQHSEFGLTGLAREAGIPKSTAHRLMAALEQRGFVYRHRAEGSDPRYRLGYRLLELGQLVAERSDLRELARPFMKELRNQTGETVHLVVRDGLSGVYLEKMESLRSLRLYTRVGLRLPLNVGACPRTLLAFAPPPIYEEFLRSGPLEALTPQTIIDHAVLSEEVERTRRLGHTVSFGEAMPDTYAIAAPIRSFSGEVVGVISLGGAWIPDRCDLTAHTEELLATVKAISAKFGYREERAL
jgi:IclR family KDG regulon transcriptional repressor